MPRQDGRPLMFITNEVFEVPALAALGRLGDRYFRTIELSLRSAWFTVTFQLADDPMKLLHTYCCSWDRQILDWLRGDVGVVITSIQQLRPTGGRQAGWEMRDVRRIWTAWDSSQEMELLIFEDAQGAEYEGWLGEAPRGPLSQRTLVADLDRPAPRARSSDRAPGRGRTRPGKGGAGESSSIAESPDEG